MSTHETSNSPLGDLFRCFARHWFIAGLFFCTSIAIAVAVTFLMPKEYRSVGKLFVRLGRENAMLDPTATVGQNPIAAVPQSRDNEINSVVQILQSRALLEKVVDALGPESVLNSDAEKDEKAESSQQQAGFELSSVLAKAKSFLDPLRSDTGLDDRQRAILLLGKNTKVESAKKSSVIEISYDGATPEQCQAVVGKLIDAYLDEHVRLNRTEGSHRFFAEQTERLRTELSERESELRDFQNSTGLVSPDAQRQLLVARVGRLEDDLLQAETAQAVAQARVDDLRAKLSTLPESEVTAETSGFGNEGTDRMRDQFYALQVREKEAQSRYTDDHPKMRQIHEQVDTARAVLEKEDRNRKQVTTEPGRLYQQTEAAIVAEEPVLASLRAQTETLQSQLAVARKDLTTLNDNNLRIAAMQRDVDLVEADYRKYANDLEQSRIDQQLEKQRMSNIAVVQAASYEPKPVRPRKLLNLLLGVGLGAFGGLAIPILLEQGRKPPPDESSNGHAQNGAMAQRRRFIAGGLIGQRRKVPR